MPRHPGAAQIKKILDSKGVNILYHFTDVSNLELISRCGGLWSKKKLEDAGLLARVITGGNDLSLGLDRRWTNWAKVHVYFAPRTPMAYRKQQESHICYLLLDRELALLQDVVFTDINATDNNQRRGEGLAGIKLVDFAAVRTGYARRTEEAFKKKQAEVLVPDQIPMTHIKGVRFISQASLAEGERRWVSGSGPGFGVDRGLFETTLPYVESALLTNHRVTSENVHTTKFIDQASFRRGENITLLVNLNAVVGTVAKTEWTDARQGAVLTSAEEGFDRTSRYWHWPSLDSSRLTLGAYCVKYFLDAVPWITIPFNVGE